MFNPCYEHCFIRYGKEYTQECDSNCEFAKVAKEKKELEKQLVQCCSCNSTSVDGKLIIDGHELIKHLHEVVDGSGYDEDYKAMGIDDFILHEPIAYDIENVVAETRKQLNKLLDICALEDADQVYSFYDKLEQAIRGGGVK